MCKTLLKTCAAALLFCTLAACTRSRISSVARIDLFNLKIGALEDQVNLFNLTDGTSGHRTSLAMRDGLFYISDTLGKKIVRYNSYGDLLFVIYNEEENPPPITLRHGIDEEGVATRWTITYPLKEPGAIAVDSRKHIYTADRADDEKRSFDEENKTLLDNVVLHFDDSGRFVNVLGQEGAGGKPFSRISGIYASRDDEIAVVCILSSGWNIYWFNADGTLLFLVHLLNEGVPKPPGRGQVFFSTVGPVYAAPDDRKLFFKVDYYKMVEDEASNTRGEPDTSLIWIMNVEDGSYADPVAVPFFEYTTTENGQRSTQHLLYSIMGVIKNQRMLLYYPVDGGYSLLVLTAGSREQQYGFIQVRNEELEYNTFNLSSDGILSGLLATELEARLVWWRTGRLLGEMNL